MVDGAMLRGASALLQYGGELAAVDQATIFRHVLFPVLDVIEEVLLWVSLRRAALLDLVPRHGCQVQSGKLAAWMLVPSRRRLLQSLDCGILTGRSVALARLLC